MDLIFEAILWYLGEDIAGLALVLFFVVGIICAIGAMAFFLDDHPILTLFALTFSIFLIYTSLDIDENGTSYQRTEAHLSQEYDLKAASNSPAQTETTKTHSGLLVYASTTTSENKDVIRYIRSTSDDHGSYYTIETQESNKVKIYEKNDQKPREKVYMNQIIISHPITGEEKVLKEDGIAHVELIIPEGSVSSNYDITVE